MLRGRSRYSRCRFRCRAPRSAAVGAGPGRGGAGGAGTGPGAAVGGEAAPNGPARLSAPPRPRPGSTGTGTGTPLPPYSPSSGDTPDRDPPERHRDPYETGTGGNRGEPGPPPPPKLFMGAPGPSSSPPKKNRYRGNREPPPILAPGPPKAGTGGTETPPPPPTPGTELPQSVFGPPSAPHIGTGGRRTPPQTAMEAPGRPPLPAPGSPRCFLSPQDPLQSELRPPGSPKTVPEAPGPPSHNNGGSRSPPPPGPPKFPSNRHWDPPPNCFCAQPSAPPEPLGAPSSVPMDRLPMGVRLSPVLPVHPRCPSVLWGAVCPPLSPSICPHCTTSGPVHLAPSTEPRWSPSIRLSVPVRRLSPLFHPNVPIL